MEKERKEVVVIDLAEEEEEEEEEPSDEENEALQRALALSLQTEVEEPRKSLKRRKEENEEEEELKKAIALSLLSSSSAEKSASSESPIKKRPRTTTTQQFPQTTNEQIEEDLKLALALSLEEQQKASSSSQRCNLSLSSSSSSSNSAPRFKSSSSSFRCFEGSGLCLNRIRGMPHQANTNALSFEQIIDAENLRSALMTTFTLDIEWLLSTLPPRGLPLTLVRHWDRVGGDKEGEFRMSRLVKIIHPPLLPCGGCMHAKVMILQYDDCLRVCITSANLTKEDWDSIGQNIWFQDFPLKQTSSSSSSPSSFYISLKQFLRSIKVDSEDLEQYDFSGAEGELVASVPGWHNRDALYQYGHMRLRSLLRSLIWPQVNAPASSSCPPIDYQMSSIGTLYKTFVSEFIESLSGAEEQKRIDKSDNNKNTRGATKKRTTTTKSQSSSSSSRVSSLPSLRLIYPSASTVQRAPYKAGAGVLMLQEKNWVSANFPKDLFHDLRANPSCDFTAAREGLLLHSKILTRSVEVEGGRFGWLYLGSHNFSGAAWGRLQKGGSQLHILNYEIGILLTYPSSSCSSSSFASSSSSQSSSSSSDKWWKNIPFQNREILLQQLDVGGEPKHHFKLA
ncbi:Tyrosyl-DNA phosphodiesterase 1 [Balamuthia mandrillaris]